jgi:hypothetical protein
MTEPIYRTTRIIAGTKQGIKFADGTHMLQRRGTSGTIHGSIGRAFLEVHQSTPTFHSKLFFQNDNIEQQHQAAGRYSLYGDESVGNILPGKLIEESLNWVEVHTGNRPGTIRQQVHAYMFGWRPGAIADDLLLLRFRYDSERQVLVDIDNETILATIVPSDLTWFDTGNVDVIAQDTVARASIDRALQIGFHQCDTKRGVDYCMRRLTWFASEFFHEAMADTAIEVFVLGDDAETPATLREPQPPISVSL